MTLAFSILAPSAFLLLCLLASLRLTRAVNNAVEHAICHVQQTHVAALRIQNKGLSNDDKDQALHHAVTTAIGLLGPWRVLALRVHYVQWDMRPWLAIRIEARLYQLKESELVTTSERGWQARNPGVQFALRVVSDLLGQYGMTGMRPSVDRKRAPTSSITPTHVA